MSTKLDKQMRIPVEKYVELLKALPEEATVVPGSWDFRFQFKGYKSQLVIWAKEDNPAKFVALPTHMIDKEIEHYKEIVSKISWLQWKSDAIVDKAHIC